MNKNNHFSLVVSAIALSIASISSPWFNSPGLRTQQTIPLPQSESIPTNTFLAPVPPVPLNTKQAPEFLDIRGVGDSGMALTYKQPLDLCTTLPEGGPANFGQRLDALDPTRISYRGDLSFINWETVVGKSCQQFRGRPSRSSYAFVSHPDNLKKAYWRIGLANNHSWDCPVGENSAYGATESARHMERLTDEIDADWIWHGVGGQQKKAAQVKTMTVKGKEIKVAFASLYLGGACQDIT